MTNYTKEIQARFYEANPDLLKLEFGCEVENGWASERNPTRIRTMYDKKSEYGVCLGSRGQKVHIGGKERQTILGKPITVLQAISLLGEEWRVNGVGEVRFYQPYKDEWWIAPWNVDPTIALFKDLPEETQGKIYKLID